MVAYSNYYHSVLNTMVFFIVFLAATIRSVLFMEMADERRKSEEEHEKGCSSSQ
jgi:capsular polysaccharide biosynthesis protein